MSDQHGLQVVFLVITWSGWSLSLLLAIFQSALHCTVRRSLSWTHSLNLLGFPFLLAHAVIITVLITSGFLQGAPCTVPNSPQKQSVLISWNYHRLRVAENSVLWTGLWGLKLSSISLFWLLIADPRTLFRRQRRVLYATTALTTLLYIACLISPMVTLLSQRTNHDCNSTHPRRIALGFSASAGLGICDGIVSIAVLTLFIMTLWHSISYTQCIRLACSPALHAFIIAIAIVRVICVNDGNRSHSQFIMLISSSASLSIANVTCCVLSIDRLRSIRQLQIDDEALLLHPVQR